AAAGPRIRIRAAQQRRALPTPVRLPRGQRGTNDRVDRALDRPRRGPGGQTHALRNPGREILMTLRDRLLEGLAIPAHPLALDASRRLDERRQRALTRYYLAAGGGGGGGGGAHTTHFALREPRHALLRPVLELAAEELRGSVAVKIAGL